jgi:diguanylate cyclase (GGDEF)-like protein
LSRLIEQTLAEQLNITAHEIEYRKHLFDFTPEDAARLKLCRPLLEDKIDAVIETFYARQIDNDEIADIIGDADTLARLKRTLRVYVLDLCGGVYDQAYVNSRLHIGKVHRRMGVSPKLYMSSMRLLQNLLEQALDACRTANRSAGDLAAMKSALHKILLLDAQFVFDAYIDSYMMDVDSVKHEVENYAHALQMKVSPGTRQLRQLSTHDALTDLYNYRSFYDFLDRELAAAERYRLPVCLVYFDLNSFKQINDEKGHEAGNRVLADVGAALLDSLRQIDIPCRYGGDEFCLILPRTEIAAAHMLCERFMAHYDALAAEPVHFSFGICQAGPETFPGRDGMLKSADILMYRAKEKSRGKPGSYMESEHLSPAAGSKPAAA